jgi:transposase
MKIKANDMRRLTVKELEKWLEREYLVLSAQAYLDSINFLKQKIQEWEKAIKKNAKLKKAFHCLKTVPGIGDILAQTIMLEVGDIKRFPKVGNFTSYWWCLPSQRLSDGKSKGHGNRKNGNRYFGWAFTGAVHLGRRYTERFREYYSRKDAQTNTRLATKALSNKLARTCYFIVKDQVPFREELFCL